MSGFFVTGTDTGVGKTLVACALLHALAERGLRVIGMKPVAAGASLRSGQLVNDDVSALKAAGNLAAPDHLVNPYCLAAPIAPHVAAAQAGVMIELERLKRAYAQLTVLADYVVVEGAGGFRVPLGPGFDTADLAAQLRIPVVLVVGIRLGCINHALLTAAAIERAGLTFAGWVANHIDPDMICADESVQALEERLAAPLLGRIPHAAGIGLTQAAALLATDVLIGVQVR
ncbi:MAG TPA: dethiobiotin synthase [Burkholderiales bacterium]|nr:dethiobiotin synthase [Burkholderiales bacterium]